MLKQRTLRNSIKAVGIGLHTGKNINMELIPSEVNTGINFIRTDVDENLVIPAIAENVGDTSLSTALVKDDVKISTIEHLLSAIAGLGVDNCLIEGKESNDWKLVDTQDVIVHIFHPKKRKFYDLENMWSEEIPKEKATI